jgi:uncharacterized protein (DUF736 family)
MSNNTANTAKEQSVGAIWQQTSQSNGSSYFSIQIELDKIPDKSGNLRLIAFPNKFKDSDNKPDFKIFVSRPKTNATTQKPQAKTVKPKTPAKVEDDVATDEPMF